MSRTMILASLVLLVVALAVAPMLLAQTVPPDIDFHGCEPGYITLTFPGGTQLIAPKICSTRVNTFVSGLTPIGTMVMFEVPEHLPGAGNMVTGTITGYQFSLYPAGYSVMHQHPTRYFVSYDRSPWPGGSIATEALILSGDFTVI